jgi:arginyl-tRNA synthetase
MRAKSAASMGTPSQRTMILPIHAAVRARVGAALRNLYQLADDQIPALVIDVPPQRAMGDLALPVAFELARRLRKAPRVIAQEIAASLGGMEGVSRVEATPNGYVNVFLDRAAFLRQRLRDGVAETATPPSPIPRVKTIVEHTAINPNKAAHIGHVRNSVLGDTLVRLLRFNGVPVEVQNYIDDTGVQVADVVVGFLHLEHLGLEDVRALAARPQFDYYCWDLYARVTEWYEEDKSRLDIRTHTLHDIESGHGLAADMGRSIADHIVRCHLQTMGRLGIGYDLLTWEGDILRLQFWSTAFDILKRQGSIFRQTSGPLSGCWVMRIDDNIAERGVAERGLAEGGEAAADPDIAEGGDAEAKEKVIVRSNGTVTYVGKDIANQFWKFGLLGKDFHYRPFATRPDGTVLWATTSDTAAPTGGADGVPVFGRGGQTYNVIDSRQAYLQRLLKQALQTMGHRLEAERSTHFSYEMVALSHATAREMGYASESDGGRPFVEVSGRKGLGVKADDLIDRVIDTAHQEVARRNPDLPDADQRRTAEQIAVAAIRYFLVKFSRVKIIVFDIAEALSFEGESGPYLQYAGVRAGNIFNKLREREGLTEADVVTRIAALDANALTDGADADALWALVLEAGRLDELAEQAIVALEPSLLAKYAFALAQQFNAFYHRYPILNEEREDARFWRAAVAAYFRRQIAIALDLMGAQVPTRM